MNSHWFGEPTQLAHIYIYVLDFSPNIYKLQIDCHPFPRKKKKKKKKKTQQQ